MKLNRLYVAGPMSGLPLLNFPAFHAAAAALRAEGLDVVNPAEINVDPSKGWVECMKADITHLVTCDGIALLPGWEHSRGAKLERHIAMELGMWLRYLPANHGNRAAGRIQDTDAAAASAANN